MKSWPWRRTERRSYTDIRVDSAVERASGTRRATVSATGVLQACAGMVSRAFALATVEGRSNLVSAVTPMLLSMAGRALIREGQVVFVIDVDPTGRVQTAARVRYRRSGRRESREVDLQRSTCWRCRQRSLACCLQPESFTFVTRPTRGSRGSASPRSKAPASPASWRPRPSRRSATADELKNDVEKKVREKQCR